FCDGKTSVLMPYSVDNKKVSADPKSPNTGGMGGYAPYMDTENIFSRVLPDIVMPVINHFGESGTPFIGCLYPGLIITPENEVFHLEYNARFGDPETELLMRLLKSDLLEIMLACATERLTGVQIEWEPFHTACVVLASGGYPGEYKTGIPIKGIRDVLRIPGIEIFHAGTTRKGGEILTAGGRVLAVTAIGPTREIAFERAYEAAKIISFEGKYYRADLAHTI
ncbi:phosphoribosylamine--glycine ligase, partial [bacterium]|nr:phosphoribosylamine--glycine ligase [bacterium]